MAKMYELWRLEGGDDDEILAQGSMAKMYKMMEDSLEDELLSGEDQSRYAVREQQVPWTGWQPGGLWKDYRK